MSAPPAFSRWPRALVTLAAPLVPRGQRDDWRAEWLAELAAHADALRRDGGGAGTRSLFAHALGAPLDAFWMRQRAIADLSWIDDLRHGTRQLAQHTGFAITAVGILAIGIAASVTAFSVVTQILLRPVPYPQPDRIITVWERRASETIPTDVSPGNFLDWRARARSFSHLAGAEPYSYDYLGGDRPEVLRTANVTEGFFDAFGIRALHGRFFRPEEHHKGANQVVVLSAALWRSHFGADPSIVGRAVQLDEMPYVVVGVAPDDFQPNLMGQRQLWAPKAIEEHEPRIRLSGYWQVVGRLADGHTLEQARAEMETIATQLEQEYPRTNTGLRTAVLSLREHLVGNVRPALLLFAAAVLAVLLIACVNVTNLLLARGAARQHELAIRTALGANRRRLLAQLLVESLLLSSIATLAGTALAVAAVRALAAIGPRDVLWIDTLRVDGAALAFAAALSVAVALCAGLVPALRLSASGLQASGQRTVAGDRSQRRLRSALVAAEIALALMLVAGSALLVRSFVNLLNVDTGFGSRGVAALQVFAWDRNPQPAARRVFFERVIGSIAALPGVEAAGAVQAMPFIESNIDIRGAFQIAGRPPAPGGEEPRSSFNAATPGYFTAMRIPLIRGRHLSQSDGPDAPRVVVISDALAERYWPDTDPIGDRLLYRASGEPIEAEIVGIVGAMRHERLEEAPRTELFMPHAQTPSGSMTIVARTSLDPRTVIEPAKAAVWAVDPLQTFYRTATLDDLVGRTLVTRRFALLVLSGFAAVALLLAAAGLYGVLSAIVSQHRREIGVRIALGAQWLDIMRLVVRQGLAVAAVGVLVGMAGVIGTSRLLGAFLFSVAPTDPLTIGTATALILIVAAAACYIPARRAALANPAEVLRTD
jgi:putative ABC transport system permease protein